MRAKNNVSNFIPSDKLAAKEQAITSMDASSVQKCISQINELTDFCIKAQERQCFFYVNFKQVHKARIAAFLSLPAEASLATKMVFFDEIIDSFTIKSQPSFFQNLISPLVLAIELQYTLIFEALMQHPNIDINYLPSFPPIAAAVLYENVEAVRALIARKEIVNLDHKLSYHYSNRYHKYCLLHYAVLAGLEEIVELLLFHPQINVNQTDEFLNNTPLADAVRFGRTKIVEILLKHRLVQVNITCHYLYKSRGLENEEDDFEATEPLIHYAVAREDIFPLLIKDYRTDLKIRSGNGFTLLKTAQNYHGDFSAQINLIKSTFESKKIEESGDYDEYNPLINVINHEVTHNYPDIFTRTEKQHENERQNKLVIPSPPVRIEDKQRQSYFHTGMAFFSTSKKPIEIELQPVYPMQINLES